MKIKNTPYKFPKFKIPTIIRLSIIGILLVIILLSIFNVTAYYQKPTTTEKSTSTNIYSQYGSFNYLVFLENNTVYEKNFLRPNEGIIFEQIVDHINASFTYNFQSENNSQISGNYYILAQIQNDYWEKTFTIVEKSYFNYSGINFVFSKEFPIDYRLYNEIVKDINEEIGVSVAEPILKIITYVELNGKTGNKFIYDSFSQFFTIGLNKKIIEISENLNLDKTEYDTEIQVLYDNEVLEQRNVWLSTTIIFLIVIFLFSIFTKNKIVIVDKVEKQLKLINKKYGEWVVETSKNNPSLEKTIIQLNSMDDLQKVSEELGKPMVHYNSDIKKQHEYYILDNDIAYQYILKQEEKIKKLAICPQCKNEIKIEGYPGSKIQIECNKCGKKGKISFDQPNIKKDLLDSFKEIFKK